MVQGLARLDAERRRSCKPFFEKCKELGIKNVHVHKGPTIWPLDKDAFDVKDVDIAATSNPELNFIVEHVGLPRIEDFCFMATQEPNVYAGLAVVLGGLMHARPRFFAKVMGELLFWVGEDKMLFGSRLRDLGAEVADRGLPRLGLTPTRGVLGLPAPDRRGASARSSASTPPSCTASRSRPSSSSRRGGTRRPRRTRSWSSRHDRHGLRAQEAAAGERVIDALDDVYDPELDEPITRLRFVSSVRGRPAGDVEVVLRLPTPQCAPNFAFLMAADAPQGRAPAARRPRA